MATTQYNLDNSASDGTSNLSYLLSEDLQSKLRTFTPGMVESVFGPGDDLCYQPSKGYTDPEWYWKSSDGCVWGIGWRWGSPRLRGKGPKQKLQNGPFWVHPKKESAAEFVKFLEEEIKFHHTPKL